MNETIMLALRAAGCVLPIIAAIAMYRLAISMKDYVDTRCNNIDRRIDALNKYISETNIAMCDQNKEINKLRSVMGNKQNSEEKKTQALKK